MDRFTEAYIECALWSSMDEDGVPLDEIDADLADEMIEAMQADCVHFQTVYHNLLLQAYDHRKGAYNMVQAGHDFWLTRNHHGAGFWDRGLGEIGEQLTKAAHVYGGIDLYVGDDGLIYGS